MIKFFLAGFFIYFTPILLSIAINFFISRIYKRNYRGDSDFRSSFVDSLIFAFVFSFFLWLFNFYEEKPIITTVIAIIFISFIPSYHFLITPMRYLFKSKNYISNDKLEKIMNTKFGNNYKIRIINKNISNAYATGIIPFSKTILLGKPLLDQMNDKEILSILLHEAGHLKLNHLKFLYFINLILSASSYFLFVFRYDYFQGSEEYINIISVFLTGCICGLLLWYLPGKLQYSMEYAADAYASKINGKDNLKKALLKLDEMSDGGVSNGGITHPTLLNRLNHIDRI